MKTAKTLGFAGSVPDGGVRIGELQRRRADVDGRPEKVFSCCQNI